jgi:hypothetical protein
VSCEDAKAGTDTDIVGTRADSAVTNHRYLIFTFIISLYLQTSSSLTKFSILF